MVPGGGVEPPRAEGRRNRLKTAKELLYHDDKLSEEDRQKLWDLLKVRDVRPQVEFGSREKETHRV